MSTMKEALAFLRVRHTQMDAHQTATMVDFARHTLEQAAIATDSVRRRIALQCVEKKIQAGWACGRKEIEESFAIADQFLLAEKGPEASLTLESVGPIPPCVFCKLEDGTHQGGCPNEKGKA